jgi:hypothetical protein
MVSLKSKRNNVFKLHFYFIFTAANPFGGGNSHMSSGASINPFTMATTAYSMGGGGANMHVAGGMYPTQGFNPASMNPMTQTTASHMGGMMGGGFMTNSAPQQQQIWGAQQPTQQTQFGAPQGFGGGAASMMGAGYPGAAKTMAGQQAFGGAAAAQAGWGNTAPNANPFMVSIVIEDVRSKME